MPLACEQSRRLPPLHGRHRTRRGRLGGARRVRVGAVITAALLLERGLAVAVCSRCSATVCSGCSAAGLRRSKVCALVAGGLRVRRRVSLRSTARQRRTRARERVCLSAWWA